jgi:glycosyltransferase involved in cell wall biosynthesis
VSVRVLIDATAVPADRGGVGRYVDGLVAALADEDLSLAVVTQATDAAAFDAVSDRVEIIAGPSSIASRPSRLAWEQTGLPGLARSVDAQVLHCPHYTMPLRSRVPTVVTLHDATFFSHPRLHSATKGRFFRAATRGALRRAAEVIAPSEATRAELVRILRVSGSRITVAHHGYDPTVFAPPSTDAIARVTSALDVQPGKYVAFLGTLEPRKNVPALVRGFVASGAADEYALVLAGGKGWDEEVEPAVEAAAPARVIAPGYLPLDDLAGYLGGAAVVAYPSLGEGFGLPVLEAMACGAAVLTTMELSLSEVGGDAVSYCGTDDASIGQSLRALLADDALRTDLRQRALQRAAQFSWQRCARIHLETYRRAALA